MAKGSYRIAGWTAAVLVLTLFVVSCSAWDRPPDRLESKEKPRIALVLGMRHGDYWKTVYLGAEAAARELGASVSFLAPNDEEDMKGQVDAIHQALRDGANALVLAPNDDSALKEAVNQAALLVPVITIDSKVKSNKVRSHIGTDNYAAGISAASQMVQLLDGRSARIGIIGFAQGTLKAEQREMGFLDGLRSHPEIEVVDKVYSFSDSQLAMELTQQMLERYGFLDGLMALNSISSIGAADAIVKAGLSGTVKLIAFDSTVRELELLQEGTIQATVVQNPFSMGYLGVRHAMEALAGQKVPLSVDTGSKVILPETMFTYENQKLLFPLLQ